MLVDRPRSVIYSFFIPSTTVVAATLVLPFPRSTIPPQSPGVRLLAAWLLVNTIGLVTVPFAISLAPLVTTRNDGLEVTRGFLVPLM
ncbi:hypothetical protein D3C85_985940 [compost metagenome]